MAGVPREREIFIIMAVITHMKLPNGILHSWRIYILEISAL